LYTDTIKESYSVQNRKQGMVAFLKRLLVSFCNKCLEVIYGLLYTRICAKHHAMKTYWAVEVILYHPGKVPCIHWIEAWWAPSWSESGGGEENPASATNQTRHQVYSLVTTLSELCWPLILWHWREKSCVSREWNPRYPVHGQSFEWL